MPWVVLFIIIVLLASVAHWIDDHPPASRLIILGLYTGAAIFIYRKFSESNWLFLYKKRARQAALDRAAEIKARRIKSEWQKTTYTIPTPEQFRYHLLRQYDQAVTRKLRFEFLVPIIGAHNTIFEKSGLHAQILSVADTQVIYDRIFEACLLALISFTKDVPAVLLEPKGYSRFESKHTLNTLLGTDDPEALLAPHYAKMAQPFPISELKDVGLFEDFIMSPADLPNPPGTLEDKLDFARAYETGETPTSIRREWERNNKAYEKSVAERDAALTHIERATANTPYWRSRAWLIPEGGLFTTPVALPEHLRFQGHWIIATQGSGKTTLLREMYLQDLGEVAAGRASIVLMDSKEDLFKFAKLKRFAKGGDLEGKLTILTPEQAFPLALNPLDLGASPAHTIDLLEHVFASLRDTKQTSLQSTLFRSIFLLLMQVPGASFADFRKILVEGIRNYEQFLPKLHPEDQDFFIKPTSEGKPEFSSRVYSDTRGQILWRLRDLTTRSPMVRDLFNAPKTTVDIPHLINTANVIIIDNARSKLGPSGSEFFSRFFLALIRAAADQRSKMADADKMPTYVYIDEAHTVIANDENVEGIIAECRSQKIALIMAHQFWTQIENEKVRSALMNCAIRMANVDADAPQIAPRLRVEPEDVQLTEGHFLAFFRDKPPRKATISFTPTAPLPIMDAGEEAEIIDEMRAKYSYQPSHLNTQLNEVDPPLFVTEAPQSARSQTNDPQDFG